MKEKWATFVVLQTLSTVFWAVGIVLLLPLSMLKAWSPRVSHEHSNKVILAWRWRPVDLIWGNEDDGVVPMLHINGNQPYLVGCPEWLRAYMWTAWRNSCKNLAWLFCCVPHSPYFPWYQRRFTIFGKPYYFQAGWRPSNGWPVLSAGAGDGSPE